MQIRDSAFRDAVKQGPDAHNDAVEIAKHGEYDVDRNVFDQSQRGIVVSDTDNEGPHLRVRSNYLLGNGDGANWNLGSPGSGESYIENNTSINGTFFDVESCNRRVTGNLMLDEAAAD